MARMYRSTPQPDYARKAEVVGNLSSTTLNMLGKLVYDTGEDTIQLVLDQTNPDQGYISYVKPSMPGEDDDYFSFDSLNYSVRLYLDEDGVILKNSTGIIYNVSTRIEGQDVSCSYEIYINFPWNTYLPNSEKGRSDAKNALLNTILTDNYKLVASGLLSNINPTGTGIVLLVQDEDGPNEDIRVTYLNLDTKETAQLVILLPLASIKEVHCSPAM